MGIFDGLFAIFALSEHRNIVHRPGAIERYQRDNVTKIGRPHCRQRAPHPFRFQLEHANGVARLQQFIGCRIIQRKLVKFDNYPAFFQHLCCLLQDRKRFQTQKVELHQSSNFDKFHVELRHRYIRAWIAVQRYQF